MLEFSPWPADPVTGVLAFVFGYVLGALPFGLIVTALAGLGDVRAQGSGNIGATNVLRLGNKKLAIVTLLGDMAKGTAAVLIMRQWGPAYAMIAGAAALIGHIAPVWLKFKGGKGVATYLGTLIGLYWPMALAFCAVWGTMAAVARLSSLAALAACIVVPAALAALGQNVLALFYGALGVIVFVTHRANIGRLLSGTEPRIGSAAE